MKKMRFTHRAVCRCGNDIAMCNIYEILDKYENFVCHGARWPIGGSLYKLNEAYVCISLIV